MARASSNISRILAEGLKPKRIATMFVLFFLLMLSLTMMKESIKLLGPGFSEQLSTRINDFPSAVGYSWVASMLVLSGSPVAAIAIGLETSSVITTEQLFGSIVGSRIGAVSIVFVLGIISLLGGKKKAGFETAIQVFIITLVMAAGALGVGYAYMQLSIPAPELAVQSEAEIPVLTPTANMIVSQSGASLSLVFSIALLVASLRMLDKTLKLPDGKDMKFSTLMKNPLVGFAIGFLLSAVFFTVAISFSLLIPLRNAGKMGKKDIVPYVIGGNIGTLSDTFILAAVLGGTTTLSAVSATVIGSLVVGLVLLASIGKFGKFVVKTTDTLVNKNAFALVALLVAVPVLLVLL